MSYQSVKDSLKPYGLDEKILTLDELSASVDLAAKALHIEPDQVAKSLAFVKEDGCIMVVTSGEKKVHNGKFKRTFGFKPHMCSAEQTLEYTTHPIGGVCPFGCTDKTEIYLDKSLLVHEFVYPACGERNNAIKITPEQMFEITKAKGWVDVVKEEA
jgi:prolyl-tRNA editing enzyme YbaK/EbsC (Cys-tRNA(Pro) deacylase)